MAIDVDILDVLIEAKKSQNKPKIIKIQLLFRMGLERMASNYRKAQYTKLFFHLYGLVELMKYLKFLKDRQHVYGMCIDSHIRNYGESVEKASDYEKEALKFYRKEFKKQEVLIKALQELIGYIEKRQEKDTILFSNSNVKMNGLNAIVFGYIDKQLEQFKVKEYI